jgi:hypothetical protein
MGLSRRLHRGVVGDAVFGAVSDATLGVTAVASFAMMATVRQSLERDAGEAGRGGG